jgi:hypothetical protein
MAFISIIQTFSPLFSLHIEFFIARLISRLSLPLETGLLYGGQAVVGSSP